MRKTKATCCAVAMAVSLLALPSTSQAVTTVLIDGTNVNGDGDGYTLNGSFEQGTVFLQKYPGLEHAITVNQIGATVNPGTDPDPVIDPVRFYTSSLGGNEGNDSLTKGITIDTHVVDGENPGDYTIALGDKFALSFTHAGAFEWLAGETLEWELYYTGDDTLEGAQTLLANGSVLPTPRTDTLSDPKWQNHWQTETVLTAEVTDSSAFGRHLWLGFKTNHQGNVGNRSYMRLDEVNLSVVGEASGLTGDYNDDGVVDASDYTVWRDNLGSSVSLPNDLTPGTVDVTDYNDWKSNYGQPTSGSLAGVSGAAVPEPASLLLLIPMAIAGMAGLRRRQ